VSGGHTVCVVDDDADVRKALSRLLRADGFEVQAFDSAEAFLAHDGPRAECLVLDVNLPDLDGLGLQRRLAESGRSCPIVFLTGFGDIPKSVQAIKAGAVDFLTKPVKADVLLPAVRAAIELGTSQRTADADVALLRARFETLSEREREVLDRIAAGKLNKQVGADLGIVEQTVKFHRGRIMQLHSCDSQRAYGLFDLLHHRVHRARGLGKIAEFLEQFLEF
jgi:FixJ family two-component response regulator